MAVWSGAYGGDGARLQVTATETSADPVSQTSTLAIKVEVTGGSGNFNGYPQTLTVSVNGIQEIYDDGFTYNLSQGNPALWGNWTVTVDRSGGINSANIVAYATDNVVPADIANVSGNLTLSPLSVDKPLELSKSNIQVGETITVYPNVESNEDMDITLYINNSPQVMIRQMATGSFNWTASEDDLIQYFGSNRTINAEVRGDLYRNAGYVRTEKVTVQISLPEDYQFEPDIGAVSITEANQSINTHFSGTKIARRSALRLSVPASGKHGAGISEVYFYLSSGGVPQSIPASFSDGTGEAVVQNLSAGDYTVYAVARDTRGATATSETESFTVVPYNSPAISSAQASRQKKVAS